MADDTSAPDAVANTGTNDPNNSMWLNGLLQTALTNGLQIGSTALTNAVQSPLNGSAASNGSPNKQIIPATQPGTAVIPPLMSDWKFWLFGGVIVVATVWLLTRRTS